LGYWHEHWLEVCAKDHQCHENVPNVLNGIRLLNSFMKLSWCNINFKKESNIIYVDIIGFNENLEK
jgi:hypothetical protein